MEELVLGNGVYGCPLIIERCTHTCLPFIQAEPPVEHDDYEAIFYDSGLEELDESAPSETFSLMECRKVESIPTKVVVVQTPQVFTCVYHPMFYSKSTGRESH